MLYMLRLLPIASLILLTACASPKPPVPPGTIPAPSNPSISDEQYGHQVVQELSERYQIDYSNPKMDKIQEIVDRLTKAAKADSQPWHVYLFKDDSLKNAAATRGNHLFIWSGMLESAKTDGELAAIISHEIGHVLAGHTAADPNEETKRILIQVLGVAAGIAASVASQNAGFAVDLGNIASSVTSGVGESLLINPYSREKELEADQIGLELMAEAKYDPEEAIKFWKRAEGDSDFSASLPFLSTHPPAPERLQRLKEILPIAEARYRGEPLPIIARRPAPTSPEPKLSGTSPTEVAPLTTTQSTTLSDVFGADSSLGGDSFDLRDNIPDAKGGEQNWADEWRVIAPKAILYAEPLLSARRLGEFRNGAIVKSIGRKSGWLRVKYPEHGFLRETDLMPVYRNRR